MDKKKKPKVPALRTPRYRVKSALRMLWLRSPERSRALKRDFYSCLMCGAKKSTAKGKEVGVEVHHLDKIDAWEEIIDLIMEKLLVDPDRLETRCVECHKKEEK
jgi:5-methylcytosine-specific restriction endonuclease McrA